MTGKKDKIRVMIVENSPAAMELLKGIINSDPRLEVAAAAASGEEALQIAGRVKPGVISLDIRLPGINGFAVTQKIMQQNPTPIVVVSSRLESEESNVWLNALRAGALAVVEKPPAGTHKDFARIARHLCTQLAIMSEVRVVKQRIARITGTPPEKDRGGKNLFPPAFHALPTVTGKPFRVMGVCASTGGPRAFLEILGKLPGAFPLPIVLVQHIGLGFLERFVSWLDSLCPQRVVMVQQKEALEPGKIYAAAPDRHLVVEKGFARPHTGPMISCQRPSATALFQSMAEHYGQDALGVLLTGMGEDGAEGLKAIKDAGGYTIAEDPSTAVVYGMPGSAARIGAVCETLPLYRIAPRILQLAPARGGKGKQPMSLCIKEENGGRSK